MEFIIIILEEIIVILGRFMAILVGLVPIPIVKINILTAMAYVLEVINNPLATIIVIPKVISILLAIIIVVSLEPMVD